MVLAVDCAMNYGNFGPNSCAVQLSLLQDSNSSGRVKEVEGTITVSVTQGKSSKHE